MPHPALSRAAALALASGLHITLASPLLAAEPDDLPITRITLYRSGVGSFVRQGAVEGDADVHLRFRTDQVNDILKSMVVLDLDSGRVESATYGSKEPLSRRLASFAVNIADSPSRAEMLDRLRGAEVEVRTAEGTHAGPVLGVEEHERFTPGGEVAEVRQVVSLVTPEGVWSSDVDDIISFRILDQELAAELTKALAALAEHRTDNVKTLDIAFRGQGEREVVVGYVHESPVWKTSYRLVIPDSEDDRLTLQGWALVENTTEEDWEDVRLSLVAGQPVSFVMDLYEPLFVDRPEVPVPTGAGARPRQYAGDGASYVSAPEPAADDAMMERGRAETRAKAVAPGRAAGAMGGFVEGESLGDAMGRSVVAAASAEDVGEVFQLTLDAPVTIGRQQSAMLPVIAGDVEGRRVSIFSQADGLAHPMRGLDLTNDTGLQLMPGPVAVYDGSAYAGDAQIGHVSRGDDRLLAYAVDLDVDARVENEGDSTVHRLRIVRGLLQQQTVDRRQTRYLFESNDEMRERSLIVEHPRSEGWDLVDTPEPKELTDDLFRFELALEPGGDARLSVTQQRTRYESVALLDFDTAALMRYASDGKASDEVVEAFREAQRLRAEVTASERTLAELEQERGAIALDQDRIRENMRTIDRNSELYSRYVQKLTEQETRLEEIVRAIATTTAERDARRTALEQYLAALNVE